MHCLILSVHVTHINKCVDVVHVCILNISVNQIDSLAGFADVRQWSWPVSAGLDDYAQVLHLPKMEKISAENIEYRLMMTLKPAIGAWLLGVSPINSWFLCRKNPFNVRVWHGSKKEKCDVAVLLGPLVS